MSRSEAGLPRKPHAQPVTLFQTRLPVDLRIALERRAAEEGVSLARLAQSAIRSYLGAAVSEPE